MSETSLDMILRFAQGWAGSPTATPNENIRHDILEEILPAARAELEELRHEAGR